MVGLIPRRATVADIKQTAFVDIFQGFPELSPYHNVILVLETVFD
jgi:hypothetical protein